MLVKIADFFAVTTDYLLGRSIQEPSFPQMLDLSGLTPGQAEHIKNIVDDLRTAADR